MGKPTAPKEPPSGARAVAIRTLRRIDKDAAWAAPTLDAEIRRASLDPRDAGLATTIVYGALRVLPSLDAWIASFLKRNAKLDPWARAALRAAAFQIRHLDRVPTHSVVNGSVEVVRRERGPKLAGFVNAVSRRLAEKRPAHPSLPDSVELPDWIQEELERSLGPTRAAAFRLARELPPPIDLWVLDDRDALIEELRRARPGAEVHAVATQAIRLRRAGDPRRLPGFKQGRFAVQELGSQRIVDLVDAKEGEHIVDACAGHGGKTMGLAKAVGPRGSVTAIELHESRVERIPAELSRLQLQGVPVELETIDLSVGTGGLEARYDRVLVDAPCSGLGTLQRRPELLLRLTPSDIENLAEQQGRILQHAAKLLRPGGTLIYAVCSPSRREGARWALELDSHGLRLDPLADSDPDGVLRLGPWSPDPTDAYQVIRCKRA